MLETYEKVIREELCISRQFFMPMAAKKQFRMKYFLGEGIVVPSPRTIYMDLDLNQRSEIRSVTLIEISLSKKYLHLSQFNA